MSFLKNATVLAIDHEEKTLLLFKELLSNECKELLLQDNIETGMAWAAEKSPNLILLDISVNKMDGYELCERLKADKETARIPIIFFSSLLRTADKVKSFEVGAAGYIAKPVEKRRAADAKDESYRVVQLADIVAKIESCLSVPVKIQQPLHTPPLTIAALLQEYHFKTREVEILRLYIAGYKRSEIATQIYLTENTVKWYLKQIFQKLAVNSRAELLEKTQNLEW